MRRDGLRALALVLGMAILRGAFGVATPADLLYQGLALLLGVPWIFNLVHALPFGGAAKYLLLGIAYLGFGGLLLAVRRLPRGLQALAPALAAALLFSLLGYGPLGTGGGNYAFPPAAIYGVALLVGVLWVAGGRAAPADPGRRRTLLWLALLPYGLARARAQAGSWIARLKGMPKEVTPVAEHYVVAKEVFPPRVRVEGYRLWVHGRVERALKLTYDELLELAAREQPTALICISNPVGGDLMGSSRWRGVPLAAILRRAGVRPEASELVLRARDNYTESVPLAFAQEEGNLLALFQNGEPLAARHGYPVRLLVPGLYGMKNVKWLTEIELVNYDYRGFWERRGWSDRAVVKTMSRIDTPIATRFADGTYGIGGVAFAGRRGVARVEVSLDGGKTWDQAELKPPLGPYAWVLWGYRFRARPGRYSAVVRAVDGEGNPQPAERRPPLPDGASGYHRRTIVVPRA